MRLIDADELNELMTAEWFLDSLASNESPREIKNKLENAIDSVPLAYDVEEVVQKLDSYITKIVGRKSKLYQTIMEIVKAGGIDG